MKKFLMAIAVVLATTLGMGVATIGTADAAVQHGHASAARTHHAKKHHAKKHHKKKAASHGWSKAQKNAVGTAKSYLSFSAFSRQGLIEQLEYEGYSPALATFGTDHAGANWYRQAVKSAKSYLSFMSFSHSGLVDQLVYEGFTDAQAEYGVSHNGI